MPYLEGLSRKFVGKKQSASNNTHDSYSNINDRMSPTEEVSSLEYIHGRNYSQQWKHETMQVWSHNYTRLKFNDTRRM